MFFSFFGDYCEIAPKESPGSADTLHGTLQIVDREFKND
jgi:hypothetical protein